MAINPKRKIKKLAARYTSIINLALASVLRTLPSKAYKLGRWAGLLTRRLRRHLTRKNILAASAISLLVLGLGYTASFLWPRTLAFSFSQPSCITNPILLPSLIAKHDSSTYKASPTASLSIAGYPLYSHTTCITATQPPEEHASEFINFNAILLKKQIRVSSEAFPALADPTILEKPVPTQDPMIIDLDSADRVFEYQLSVNDNSLRCNKESNLVKCNISQLNLNQSTTYDFKLERLFNGSLVGTIFQKPLTTVESVQIVSASVGADQTIYGVPAEITLTLNRPVVSLEGAHLYLLEGDDRQEVAITPSLNDQTITVSLQEPLARNASFLLTVEKAEAADGGFLASPYVLNFKTSGGPKVVRVNIGSYKIATTASVSLTFDSALGASQSLNSFIRLEIGGNPVAATITQNGKTVTVKPQADLPRCTTFTVKVLDGLKNEFGISGGSAWQYKSRTICQTVFSIGTSVQGRSILAYRFGSGSSKIIFVGAMHGNEKSSTYLLNQWINTLEAQYDRIPSNRTIVIIPILNPDGYAANQRMNARGVDLNRNFPSNDWKSGVTMPDGSYHEHGGGTHGLSEPESQAIANYVLSQSPRVVLSYHAAGAVVIPNESGDSESLAHTYADKSTVGYLSNGSTGGFFDYDTTGAFESWMHDRHNITALLIELITKTGNEFSGHQNALWFIAGLP